MEFTIFNLLSILLLAISIISLCIVVFKNFIELKLINRRLTKLETDMETWRKAHSKCTESCCVEKGLEELKKKYEN
jgi:hypothetical protein